MNSPKRLSVRWRYQPRFGPSRTGSSRTAGQTTRLFGALLTTGLPTQFSALPDWQDALVQIHEEHLPSPLARLSPRLPPLIFWFELRS